MNYILQKILPWFFADYHFKLQTQWFKRLLYAWLMIHAIVWHLQHDLYFGAHSIFFTSSFSIGAFKDPAFLLYFSSSPTLAYFFIWLLFILCLLGLVLNRVYFIFDFLIWFLVVNLHNKMYASLTGGDYLLNQLLFFNCFLSASCLIKTTILGDLKICFHNLAVLGVIIQVCVVYFLSGLAKCNDELWRSGNAIEQLAQVKHFNLYSGVSVFKFHWLSVLMSYFVIFYQLTFPVLVWFKKVKKPLIVLGILNHLYIALVMGLVGFGLIMILPYLYFWPFKKTIP